MENAKALPNIPGISQRLEELFADVPYGIVAQSIGMSRRRFENYILTDTIGIYALKEICLKFGVSADWLLFGEGQPFEKESHELKAIRRKWTQRTRARREGRKC